jgi:hypothetical protein
MMGRFVRALIVGCVLFGGMAGSASRALATTMTIPAGYEAVISNTSLGGCSPNTYGYQIGAGGIAVELGSKPAGCVDLAQPDVTAGPVDSPQMIRLYLQDSACEEIYYSDGTPYNHALVVQVPGANLTYKVAIGDGGPDAGTNPCPYKTVDRPPTDVTQAQLTATVTIVGAPPAVTVTAPAPPSGQSGYFNSANLAADGGSIPVSVSATEGTGNGMKSISCTDNGVGVPVLHEAGAGTKTMTGTVAVSANGSHAISCLGASNVSATGNTGGSNTATVGIDSTSPKLIVPASPFVVVASSLSGVQLSSYGVSAADSDDSPSFSCAPAAPALLPVGDTTVSCHAVDRAGNASTAQFVVRVKPPPSASASVGSVRRAGATAVVTITCTGVPGQRCRGTLVATAREVPTLRMTTACDGSTGQACAREAKVMTTERLLAGNVLAVSAHEHGRRPKSQTVTVTVARRRFTVPAGESAKLVLALNQMGKRLLAEFYRLPVRLSLASTKIPVRTITLAYPRVDATTLIHYTAAFKPGYTIMQAFSVTGLPARASIELRCHGPGCPFTDRTTHPRTRDVTLTSIFGDAHLRPGATVYVGVSALNMIGEAEVIRVRAGAQPTQTDLCLVPDLRLPQRCR